MFNVRLRKVGGIWFLKLGRITMSLCVSRELKGFGPRDRRWDQVMAEANAAIAEADALRARRNNLLTY